MCFIYYIMDTPAIIYKRPDYLNKSRREFYKRNKEQLLEYTKQWAGKQKTNNS